VPCCALLCRYIISQPASISAKFITDTLKAAFPAAAALPDGKESDTSHINSSRIQTDLGLQYTPVADTVRDMAQALLKCGIAKPAWYSAASS
jgi:sensor domain CHASE-containing protein